MRFFLPLAAALLAASAVPAAARDDARAKTETSADGGALTLREFVTLLNESPEMREILDQVIAEMLRPDAPVEGWSQGGVDMTSLLIAFEAEHGSAYLIDRATEIVSVLYAGPPQDLLGDGLARHELVRRDMPGVVESGLVSASPGLWIEAVAVTDQIGNAQCNSATTQAWVLADRPLSEWSSEEIGTVAAFAGMLPEFDENRICTVYHQVGENSFDAVSYLDDGRPLPGMTFEDEAWEIVTREELMAFLGELRAAPRAP